MATVAKRSIMTLYTGSDDVYSHQVRIVLAEKGVNFEAIEVLDSRQPPEDLIDLNPYNTVPTLVDRELVLFEAPIIMEYLDERFPHPPLMPVYPVARAQSRLWIYRIKQDWCALVDALMAGDGTPAQLEKKRFYPTDVGRVVVEFLTDNFTSYVDYDFTASLEDELDAVSRGEKEWIPLMNEFWGSFHNLIGREYDRPYPKPIDEKCPDCGKQLQMSLGRSGFFIGCSGYPDCKYIEPLEKPEDTGVQCPECKKGNILKRKSRRGKIFFSCATYPKCDYATWNEPLAEICPKCNWPVLTLKTTKRSGTQKVCPQKECDFVENVEED